MIATETRSESKLRRLRSTINGNPRFTSPATIPTSPLSTSHYATTLDPWSTLAVNSPRPSWVRTWSPALSCDACFTSRPFGIEDQRVAAGEDRLGRKRLQAAVQPLPTRTPAQQDGLARRGPGRRSAGRVRVCRATSSAPYGGARARRCAPRAGARISAGRTRRSWWRSCVSRPSSRRSMVLQNPRLRLRHAKAPDRPRAADGARWSPACARKPRAAPSCDSALWARSSL